MNSTFVRKPFSALELAGGSAALAVVALIAFVGLRVPQPQVSSSAVPSSGSNVVIPSPRAFSRAPGQLSERSETVGSIRKPQSFDPGSAGVNVNLLEPGGAKTPSSPPADRLLPAEAGTLGRSGIDYAAGPKQRLVGEGLIGGFSDDIEGIRSRNAQRSSASAHAAGSRKVGDRRTQGKPLARSSDPSPPVHRTELSMPDQTAEAAIAPSAPIAQNSLTRGIRPENSFFGGWADDIGECRQDQHHGAPIVISTHVAKTASAECDFRSVTRQTASRWHVVARCSSTGESWIAHINLKLAGSSLTWSSERGTERYVRCSKPQSRHDRAMASSDP